MAWFEDPEIICKFPLLYRGYALYCRYMVDRSTNIIRGGSFLLRRLAFLTKTFGLKDHAEIQIYGNTVYIDLCDSRWLWVLDEVRGINYESKIMRSTISKGDTFLDVGSNHGSYSIIAAKLIGPEGRIIAFEPQPRLASLVKKSLQATGLRNWQVHEIACGDQKCTADFYIPFSGSGSASIYKRFLASSRHSKITVKIERLDDAVEWREFPGRVFVKLDVEGSELSFIRGAAQMIQFCRPTILLEINPTSAEAADSSARRLLETLQEFGYERFSEIEDYPETITLQEVDWSKQRNIVALPTLKAN